MCNNEKIMKNYANLIRKCCLILLTLHLKGIFFNNIFNL